MTVAVHPFERLLSGKQYGDVQETLAAVWMFPGHSNAANALAQTAKQLSEADDHAAFEALVLTWSRQIAESSAMDLPPELCRRQIAPAYDALQARMNADVSVRMLRAYGSILRYGGPDFDGEARTVLQKACVLAPGDADNFIELGLLHKWRGRHSEAAEAFARARSFLGSEDRTSTRACLWNECIATLCMGALEQAAQLLRELGFAVEISPSGVPKVAGVPERRVRVPSRAPTFGTASSVDHAFEVVTVAPISPMHGVVITPTLREAAIDYGDVIVWDGAPIGRGEDQTFPLLEVLRRSEVEPLRFAALGTQSCFEAVGRALAVDGHAVMVVQERVQSDEQDDELAYGKVLYFGDLRECRSRLDAVLREQAGLRFACPALYEKTGTAKRGGEEHQAFRAIEVLAEKRGLTAANRVVR